MCVYVFEKKAFLMSITQPIALPRLSTHQIRSDQIWSMLRFISITINHIDSFICLYVSLYLYVDIFCFTYNFTFTAPCLQLFFCKTCILCVWGVFWVFINLWYCLYNRIRYILVEIELSGLVQFLEKYFTTISICSQTRTNRLRTFLGCVLGILC